MIDQYPCKWCGREHLNEGTKMCDRCWELWNRIQADLHLAKRMLRELTDIPW